jgi:hypothetical protein
VLQREISARKVSFVGRVETLVGARVLLGEMSVRSFSGFMQLTTCLDPCLRGSRITIKQLMIGVERGFVEASGAGDSLGFNPAN